MRIPTLTLIFGLAVSVWGAPNARQGAPQFGARVDLIRLDVSVVDRNHQPIQGLTASDFTVLEDNKPQRIQTFLPVVLADEPASTAPWIRDIAPDVVSNTGVDEDRLVVIVMDDYSDDVSKDLFAMRSVKEVARGIVDRLGPRDLGAVVYTVASKHNQEFTHDRERLRAAVDHFDPAAVLPQFSTLAVLERVCLVLGSVENRRKVVIWVSPGVVPPGSNLRSVIKIAQSGNVNIYPIDPAGIRPATFPPPAQNSAADVAAVPSLRADTERMNDISRLNLLRENMFVLAGLTGGQSFQWNEFKKSINQVFRETGSFYLLGYVSSQPVVDDKRRTLTVRVNRPGAKVSARTGYFPTLKDEAAALPAPNRVALDALSGLVPVRGIPLRLTAAPFAGNVTGGNGMSPTVAVSIGLAPPADGTDELDIVIKAFTFDGEPRQTKNLKARIDARTSSAAEPDRQVHIVDELSLPPGRYQLRVGATNARLQTSGSVYADVDVPDFARERLSLSGVALTERGMKPVVTEDAQARLSVMPVTARSFNYDHHVSGRVEVYQGLPSKLEPVTLNITIRDSGEHVVFKSANTFPVAQFVSAPRVTHEFELPLAALSRGEYLLVVEAVGGVSRASRSVRFTRK